LKGIYDEQAGRYRSVPVRISGSAVVLPNPRKVPGLMEEFGAFLARGAGKDGVPAFAAEAHLRLVSIHPFVDGNGRTARLLMNLILLRGGYPPVPVGPADRKAYLDALETASLAGDLGPFQRLMCERLEGMLDEYLGALRG